MPPLPPGKEPEASAFTKAITKEPHNQSPSENAENRNVVVRFSFPEMRKQTSKNTNGLTRSHYATLLAKNLQRKTVNMRGLQHIGARKQSRSIMNSVTTTRDSTHKTRKNSILGTTGSRLRPEVVIATSDPIEPLAEHERVCTPTRPPWLRKPPAWPSSRLPRDCPIASDSSRGSQLRIIQRQRRAVDRGPLHCD